MKKMATAEIEARDFRVDYYTDSIHKKSINTYTTTQTTLHTEKYNDDVAEHLTK